MSTADHIALIILCAATPAAYGFPLLYGATSSWWRSALGRALMVKGTAIAMLTTAACYVLFTGNTAPAAVRIPIFSLITLGVWWQFVAITLTTLRARRERKAH